MADTFEQRADRQAITEQITPMKQYDQARHDRDDPSYAIFAHATREGRA
ncbi:hypothetical protein [Novosphingobium sp. BL-52-GroH]